jgi:branched-chain amino acid transport system permease protein
MAGAIWAYFVEAVYPATAFDPMFDIAIALMAFLGGLGTITGPLLGALILEPTQQYFALAYGQNGYYLIVYGALFLVVILLLPQGIVPSLQVRWSRFQAVRAQERDRTMSMVSHRPTAGEDGSPEVETKEGANL